MPFFCAVKQCWPTLNSEYRGCAVIMRKVFFKVPMKRVLLSAVSLSLKPHKDIRESLGSDIKRQALWRGTLQSCHQSINISTFFSLCLVAKEQPFAWVLGAAGSGPGLPSVPACHTCAAQTRAVHCFGKCMSFHQVLLHYWDLQGLLSSNSLWPHGAHFLHSPSVAEDEQSCLPHLCRETEPAGELHAGKAELRLCVSRLQLLLLGKLCSASRHLRPAQSRGITHCVSGFEWTWWGVCML